MDKLQEIKQYIATQNFIGYQSYFLYGNAEIPEINQLQTSFDLLLYLIEVGAPLSFIEFTAQRYPTLNYSTRYKEEEDVIPLFYAVEQEAFSVAEILLKYGAQIHYRITAQRQPSYNLLTYLYHQKKSLSRRQLFFLLHHGLDIHEGQNQSEDSQGPNQGQGQDNSFLFYVVDHQDLPLLHTLIRYTLFGPRDHRALFHLLQASHQHQGLSDEQLHTLVETEKKKLNWTSAMYTSAVRHKNLPLLRTIYQYDPQTNYKNTKKNNNNNKNVELFQQLLSLACSSTGQLPIIQFLVEEVGVSVNVDSNNSNNESVTMTTMKRDSLYTPAPLIVSARYGFQDYARILLEHGADVNVQNSKGFTALMMACQYGKEAMVRLLVDHGADIHMLNLHQHSALMYACEEEHVEICRYLIEKGADVNGKDGKDSTILMNAARSGNKELVNLLFQQPNLHYNEKNYNGWNALMYGCFAGSSPDILQGLIDRGEALEDPDVNGFTSLMVACLNGKKKVVEFLMEKGVDVNKKNKSGATALMVVSQNGHRDIVKLLLDHGARIDECDHLGNTALMYATLNKQKWIADDLVQEGANINARNLQGDSPLLMACRNGSRALIELFLRNGAEVNAPNHKNLTPLQVTQMRGFQDLSRVLMACGARPPPESELYL